MTEAEKKTDGWAWPNNSRKAHYFISGRSLCGKWMYLGSRYDTRVIASPDDCRACAKKLEGSV